MKLTFSFSRESPYEFLVSCFDEIFRGRNFGCPQKSNLYSLRIAPEDAHTNFVMLRILKGGFEL